MTHAHKRYMQSSLNACKTFNIMREDAPAASVTSTSIRRRVERMVHTPVTDTESSLPTVGVVAALIELVEEMEEVLSALANGAMGGGLAE